MKPFSVSSIRRRTVGGKSLFAALVVSALAFAPVEESRAQLYIDVYQSRENANQTLWVFSGSSTARGAWSVRTAVSGNDNFHRRDTWEVVENSGSLYIANAPSAARFSLTSITNQNALTSRDRWYVVNVLTNAAFAGADGTPTITLTTNSVTKASRAIDSLFMNDDTGTGATDRDELGIRVSGSNFGYALNDVSSWSGAGLVAKPLSDFYSGATDGTFVFNNFGASTLAASGPFFAANSQGSVVLRFHRGTVIPEPQEYALVFGLFALGFVIVRRYWRRGRRSVAASA